MKLSSIADCWTIYCWHFTYELAYEYYIFQRYRKR